MSEILPYLCRRPSRWCGLQLRMCWGHSQGMLSCESQGTSTCNSAWTYHQNLQTSKIETEQFRGGPCHQPERPTPNIPKPCHIFPQTYPTPTQALKKRPLTLLKQPPRMWNEAFAAPASSMAARPAPLRARTLVLCAPLAIASPQRASVRMPTWCNSTTLCQQHSMFS